MIKNCYKSLTIIQVHIDIVASRWYNKVVKVLGEYYVRACFISLGFRRRK